MKGFFSARNIVAGALLIVTCFFLWPHGTVAAAEGAATAAEDASSALPPDCKKADAGTAVCNPRCWTRADCEAKGNEFSSSSSSDKECGDNPLYGYCFVPNVPTKLQVPLFGVVEVNHIGDYIRSLYFVAAGIAGLLGVLLFIHGGLLYAVSAGDTSTIAKARDHMKNAALGMILVFGSYTVLHAVSPDLVRLRVPRAAVMRDLALEFSPRAGGGIKEGDICDASNQLHKNECRGACAGCDCVAFGGSPLKTVAEYTMWATAILFTGGTALAAAGTTATGFSIGTAAKVVGGKLLASTKSTFSVLKKIGGIAKNYPRLSLVGFVAGLELGEEVKDRVKNKMRLAYDEPGVCIPVAVHELDVGDLCATDRACKEGLRCITEEEFSLGKVGVCSDGSEGSACNVDGDCEPIPGGSRQTCVEGPVQTHWCAPASGRAVGSPCRRDQGVASDCKAGLTCQVVSYDWWTFEEEGLGWCVKEGDTGGQIIQEHYIGEECGPGTCPGEHGGLQDLGYRLTCKQVVNALNPFCSRLCSNDTECEAGCPDGKNCVCSGLNGTWCVALSEERQKIKKGASGCEDTMRFECDMGLRCTEGPVVYRGLFGGFEYKNICVDGVEGSPCSVNSDCLSTFCEIVGDAEIPSGREGVPPDEREVKRCA